MKDKNEASENEDTPMHDFRHDFRRETSLHAAITSFNCSGPVGTDKIVERAGEFYAFLISGDIAAQSE